MEEQDMVFKDITKKYSAFEAWLNLAITQKKEFASVIETNNGDITKLFITLKEFVAK